MGLLSNKISRDDLKPGDHIYSWRKAYTFSHHGIYVGDGKVIHFTIRGRTFLGKFMDVSSVPSYGGGKHPCLICGDQSNLDCFLAGGKIYLFKYDVSKTFYIAKTRGGTCTIATSDPSDEVISRAKFLHLHNGFGAYHLLENKCEDFAIYCKTGLVVSSDTKCGNSGQINAVSAVGGVLKRCKVGAIMVPLALGSVGGMAFISIAWVKTLV